MTVTVNFFTLTVFESGSVSIDRLIGKRVSYLCSLERSIFILFVPLCIISILANSFHLSTPILYMHTVDITRMFWLTVSPLQAVK
jgi:hypothetical protein